jgi:phage head maturation protease
MQIRIELPGDVFDAQFREADFRERVRELAILELVRVKRLHEHEAQEMLGVTRWQLVERMKASGIVPTEEAFDNLREELTKAIGTRRARVKNGESRK